MQSANDGKASLKQTVPIQSELRKKKHKPSPTSCAKASTDAVLWKTRTFVTCCGKGSMMRGYEELTVQLMNVMGYRVLCD